MQTEAMKKISLKDIKLRTTVSVKAIYPEKCGQISILMGRETATQLGISLLQLANDPNSVGDVVMGGWSTAVRKEPCLTVNAYKYYTRKSARR